MRLNKPAILITNTIDQSSLNKMIAKGINAEVIPFIHIEIIRTKTVHQQIADALKLNAVAVFTSMHAAEAVNECLKNNKPVWKIYCIGNTTRLAVEKIFGKASIIATAGNAKDLAEKIIAGKSSKEVHFFCGDKRRNELPGLLRSNNIKVNEIEVYTTTILQHKIDKNYDAILFFSPSAVEGFFRSNAANEKTILFAIGNTTAEEIKKCCGNKIVISDKPRKQNLIEKAIAFFEIEQQVS